MLGSDRTTQLYDDWGHMGRIWVHDFELADALNMLYRLWKDYKYTVAHENGGFAIYMIRENQ